MPKSAAAEQSAFLFYEFCWRLAIPLLRRNARLQDGFAQRILQRPAFGQADIWIQAASAGEAHLASTLLKSMSAIHPLRVYTSTNTRQGLDILEGNMRRFNAEAGCISVVSGFFPFDQPHLMQKAIRVMRPRLLVLLETEIWPGLLKAAWENRLPVIILNGRITAKSHRHYGLIPNVWKSLCPSHILAVSREDARRFGNVFPNSQVAVMPNMKFDQIDFAASGPRIKNGLKRFLPANHPVLVLGSVRREEERDVAAIISAVRNNHPRVIIALFPRHMHRVERWRQMLAARKIPCTLRSQADGPVKSGVLLGDVFGELASAYALASAVFVGGTLARLGGQNFLEPLAHGLSPVIGPHWETFRWVGNGIVRKNIVRVGGDWREVLSLLDGDLRQRPDRKAIRSRGRQYIENRQGGTTTACRLIERLLSAAP